MKLISVDLEAGIPAVLAPVDGDQWVLVRYHRHPLGLLALHRHACTGPQLEALILERCGERLRDHIIGDNLHAPAERVPLTSLTPRCPRWRDVELPALTIAVCTRDGAERIGAGLDALIALAYPPDRLELLVVDNARQDDALERLVTTRYPRLRYVHEPRPGLDWARNRAWHEARGTIVAYTDDDVAVDSWWAQAIGRVFIEDPHVMAVTGLVVPDEMDVEAQRLFEEYGGFGRGFKRRYFRVDAARERAAPRHAGAGAFGTGANMAFRRSVFDAIGGFDPALDVGTVTNGGGDLDMFFRVLKAGHTLVYEPAAIVRHRHRRTYAALRTQLANNGVGFYSYLVRTAQAYPDERAAIVRLGVWWFWWWNVRRYLSSLVRPSFPRDLVAAELRGSLAGLFRYGRARREARAIARQFDSPAANA